MASRARYVIAVRRETRQSVPEAWQERVGEVPGVRVLGRSARRVQIEADEEAVDRLRESLGGVCHIEKVISHDAIEE